MSELIILPLPYYRDLQNSVLEVNIGTRLGYEGCSSFFLQKWEASLKVKQTIEIYHQAGWADAELLTNSPVRCPACGTMKVVGMLNCPCCSWSYD